MSKPEWNKKIKNHLIDQTESITELKESTWQNIDKELFPTVKKKKRRRRTKQVIVSIAGAAMIMLFIMFSSNEQGLAMMQSIREIFVEEKKQIVELEGNKEVRDVHLNKNYQLEYVLYVDESYYKVIEQENSDLILPKMEFEDIDVPEISMEIMQHTDISKDELIDEVITEITDSGLTINQEEEVMYPLESLVIKGVGNTEEYANPGDTPIHRYYIKDTGSGQLFLIKQVYFLTAAEGHGVRLNSMLETFEVISNN
ncbi:hypothetical protein [Ornithinibacillus halophilus]|uniref:DUF4367 domain-containing protein n=1 Tax=Ornithinibacillus halophilus TaxID=930117 RepID=A0A1M5GBY1_9BACI|nr:hypothetical protein [Ornithinibacillus halophilus]SHG01243.1 hypothetical protein SAMN05216225_101244 [Ornithinibacillus halophilus]